MSNIPIPQIDSFFPVQYHNTYHVPTIHEQPVGAGCATIPTPIITKYKVKRQVNVPFPASFEVVCRTFQVCITVLLTKHLGHKLQTINRVSSPKLRKAFANGTYLSSIIDFPKNPITFFNIFEMFEILGNLSHHTPFANEYCSLPNPIFDKFLHNQ